MAKSTFLSGSTSATWGTRLLHAMAEDPPIVGFVWAATQLDQIALAPEIPAPRSLGEGKNRESVLPHL